MSIADDDNEGNSDQSRLRKFLTRIKQWKEWREWLFKFFSEVYNTKIAFWDQPTSMASKDVVLTGFGLVAIHLARSTHAAYPEWGGSSAALMFVLIAVFFMAYGACLLDLACRTSLADYQKNAKECCRVLWIGVLLSAIIISLNHFVPWSEELSYRLDLGDDDQEIRWAVAAPAALASFIVILINSLSDSSFRSYFSNPTNGSAVIVRSRAVLWSIFFIAAIFLSDLIIFRDDQFIYFN